jgi:hypothetical protein
VRDAYLPQFRHRHKTYFTTYGHHREGGHLGTSPLWITINCWEMQSLAWPWQRRGIGSDGSLHPRWTINILHQAMLSQQYHTLPPTFSGHPDSIPLLSPAKPIQNIVLHFPPLKNPLNPAPKPDRHSRQSYRPLAPTIRTCACMT